MFTLLITMKCKEENITIFIKNALVIVLPNLTVFIITALKNFTYNKIDYHTFTTDLELRIE